MHLLNKKNNCSIRGHRVCATQRPNVTDAMSSRTSSDAETDDDEDWETKSCNSREEHRRRNSRCWQAYQRKAKGKRKQRSPTPPPGNNSPERRTGRTDRTDRSERADSTERRNRPFQAAPARRRHGAGTRLVDDEAEADDSEDESGYGTDDEDMLSVEGEGFIDDGDSQSGVSGDNAQFYNAFENTRTDRPSRTADTGRSRPVAPRQSTDVEMTPMDDEEARGTVSMQLSDTPAGYLKDLMQDVQHRERLLRASTEEKLEYIQWVTDLVQTSNTGGTRLTVDVEEEQHLSEWYDSLINEDFRGDLKEKLGNDTTLLKMYFSLTFKKKQKIKHEAPTHRELLFHWKLYDGYDLTYLDVLLTYHVLEIVFAEWEKTDPESMTQTVPYLFRALLQGVDPTVAAETYNLTDVSPGECVSREMYLWDTQRVWVLSMLLLQEAMEKHRLLRPEICGGQEVVDSRRTFLEGCLPRLAASFSIAQQTEEAEFQWRHPHSHIARKALVTPLGMVGIHSTTSFTTLASMPTSTYFVNQEFYRRDPEKQMAHLFTHLGYMMMQRHSAIVLPDKESIQEKERDIDCHGKSMFTGTYKALVDKGHSTQEQEDKQFDSIVYELLKDERASHFLSQGGIDPAKFIDRLKKENVDCLVSKFGIPVASIINGLFSFRNGMYSCHVDHLFEDRKLPSSLYRKSGGPDPEGGLASEHGPTMHFKTMFDTTLMRPEYQSGWIPPLIEKDKHPETWAFCEDHNTIIADILIEEDVKPWFTHQKVYRFMREKQCVPSNWISFVKPHHLLAPKDKYHDMVAGRKTWSPLIDCFILCLKKDGELGWLDIETQIFDSIFEHQEFDLHQRMWDYVAMGKIFFNNWEEKLGYEVPGIEKCVETHKCNYPEHWKPNVSHWYKNSHPRFMTVNIGVAGTGKSSFLDICKFLLNSTKISTIDTNTGGENTFGMMGKSGKTLLACDELGDCKNLEAPKLTTLVSAELTTENRKNLQNRQFYFNGHLMGNANSYPHFWALGGKNSGQNERRILLNPFKKKLSGETNFNEKLKTSDEVQTGRLIVKAARALLSVKWALHIGDGKKPVSFEHLSPSYSRIQISEQAYKNDTMDAFMNSPTNIKSFDQLFKPLKPPEDRLDENGDLLAAWLDVQKHEFMEVMKQFRAERGDRGEKGDKKSYDDHQWELLLRRYANLRVVNVDGKEYVYPLKKNTDSEWGKNHWENN